MPFINLVIGIFISVVCWVLWAMTLLSLPAYTTSGGGFMSLTPDLPFTRSAFYGLIVGIAHLSVNVTLIYLWEVDSILGTLVSSILATEILIILGMMIGLILHFRKQRRNIRELKRYSGSTGKPIERRTFGASVILWAQGIFVVGIWVSILSAFFIIPSIIVGIAARLFV